MRGDIFEVSCGSNQMDATHLDNINKTLQSFLFQFDKYSCVHRDTRNAVTQTPAAT
jgi:hypothetical protein